MVKTKICGLFRPQDIETVNLERPDFVGFVFAESRRRVTPKQAYALRKQLSPGIVPVGVFVDEAPENILSLVSQGVIEMIQLHGSEDEAYIKQLKSLGGLPVIKANGPADSEADYLLFDGIVPGSGQTIEWASLRHVGRPFFLAGGLSPENVVEAIRVANPFVVDVSSGVESGGVKDPQKIHEFIKRVKNYETYNEQGL